MRNKRNKKTPVTAFYEKIYAIVKNIPRGKVTTYAALARTAGSPRASRAVGNCMHRNPYAPYVPCHRVVCSDGRLGGFADGSVKKESLLKKEGVRCVEGKIKLESFFWDPQQEGKRNKK
jgi:methylated-DNA-[protein]-cysteine S-methyltransferase